MEATIEIQANGHKSEVLEGLQRMGKTGKDIYEDGRLDGVLETIKMLARELPEINPTRPIGGSNLNDLSSGSSREHRSDGGRSTDWLLFLMALLESRTNILERR